MSAGPRIAGVDVWEGHLTSSFCSVVATLLACGYKVNQQDPDEILDLEELKRLKRSQRNKERKQYATPDKELYTALSLPLTIYLDLKVVQNDVKAENAGTAGDDANDSLGLGAAVWADIDSEKQRGQIISVNDFHPTQILEISSSQVLWISISWPGYSGALVDTSQAISHYMNLSSDLAH